MVAVFNLQVVSNAILATIRALLGLVFYPNYRTLYDRVQGFISCSVLLLSRISVYFLIGGGLEQARDAFALLCTRYIGAHPDGH